MKGGKDKRIPTPKKVLINPLLKKGGPHQKTNKAKRKKENDTLRKHGDVE